MNHDGYKLAVEHIIEKFRKPRQTKFANSRKCTISDVHIHNHKPIWFLVKKFKEQNSIKTRVFKSLTPEQQTIWITFYDQNKDLKIMTNEQHTQFHNSYTFNIKTETWIENKTSCSSSTSTTVTHNKVSNEPKITTNSSSPQSYVTEKHVVKSHITSKQQKRTKTDPTTQSEKDISQTVEQNSNEKPKRGAVRIHRKTQNEK